MSRVRVGRADVQLRRRRNARRTRDFSSVSEREESTRKGGRGGIGMCDAIRYACRTVCQTARELVRKARVLEH